MNTDINKKKMWLGIVLVFIIMYVVSNSIAKNSTIVKIGVLTPLSGPIAAAGEAQKNAISMAIEDLKAKGMDLSKFKIIYEDSRYDPKTALSGYEALKQKGVKIIIADGSPVVAAIREKAEKDQILVFAQSATTPAFTDFSPFTCRLGLTADVIGPSISNLAMNVKAENIVILASNNEYGQTMKDQIIKSYAGRVLAVEMYDQASGDLRTNILKLMPSKDASDAMIVINNITPEQMFKQLKEMGWNKPILSDIWTMTSPNLKNRTLVNGVRFVDYMYSPQANLNTNKDAESFATRYEEKYKTSPILLSALTYDTFNILFKTIETVGQNPILVTRQLLNIHDYKGITGMVDMDTSCQNINKELVWRKVKADGTFEGVKY
jgi:branched-chain amino acid transport system substrate-binding protein